MDRPRALGLLLALLTLCITAGEWGPAEKQRPRGRMENPPGPFLCLCPTGTPEVWVQVQMEATESPSFTVRCGFLGSGSISLVTVSYGGPDGAGGTMLAVLHPEFGTQHWAPACQAHWETRTSISLTLEGSEGRSSSPNTTFCCKFTSFPEGFQEACGNLSLSTDQGLPAPTPAPMLRADLAGILGVSGVLFFGCICLLYLLYRQRHWSIMKLQPPRHRGPQTQRPASVRIRGSFWRGERSGRELGRREAEPHLDLLPRHPCRQPAKPPGPLSTSPTPPSTPTTSAQKLWPGSSRPSHCAGGRRPPPARCAAPRAPPPGRHWPPLRAAASSWSRTDSMLRQKGGLSTPAPTSSLTLLGAEPWRVV
ncbi:transmembrane protein PVRIG isoform X1 [Camelus dromedarius]|uniref:transmembrane protein PVRIG isoform X1 n=1 Tax=Camelus dromedarius TaxID=9838 RepID=UPI001263DC2F|nr:transmembrane protein PVRIG isoform X1 [Camelus dromedarius]